MSKLGLNRSILDKITNGNHEAIKALERVFSDVGGELPDAVEAALTQAAQAIATANQALGMLADVTDSLDQLLHAPAPLPVAPIEDYTPVAAPAPEGEDYRPATQFGSIAIQDAENVDITGGTIGLSAGTVAEPSFYLVDRNTGFYRIGANNWGFSVAGVKKLDFTAGRATFEGELHNEGGFNFCNGLIFSNGTTSIQYKGVATIANAEAFIENTDGAFILHASSSGGVSKALHLISSGGTSPELTVDAAGVAVVGQITATGVFGVNGATPQGPYPLPAAATDLPSVIALANGLAQLVKNNGQAT